MLETQRTTTRVKPEPCDPRRLERGVRQLLADKVSGNLVGLWLLVPEHLRLGTWDLLCGWARAPADQVEPRLAPQLVHEATLCLTGIRPRRALSQRGFELLNGLPFLASDPHRIRSYSQRQMRRQRQDNHSKPAKMAQTFLAIDADTHQPVCFVTGTSSRTVTQATPELLKLAAEILQPQPHQTLILADAEHFTAPLLDDLHEQTHFDLLVPMPDQPSLRQQLRAIPPEKFTRHWAGYATAKLPYQLKRGRHGPFFQFVQRLGERPEEWEFKAFLATADREEATALTRDFPQRWHAEEFFNAHLAQALFQGLEGDVRVSGQTILVTYYNAPHADRLRDRYEHLPTQLARDGLDPRIPWLYDFNLDFRFR